MHRWVRFSQWVLDSLRSKDLNAFPPLLKNSGFARWRHAGDGRAEWLDSQETDFYRWGVPGDWESGQFVWECVWCEEDREYEEEVRLFCSGYCGFGWGVCFWRVELHRQNHEILREIFPGHAHRFRVQMGRNPVHARGLKELNSLRGQQGHHLHLRRGQRVLPSLQLHRTA